MNPLAWLRKHLDDEGGNDLVREMVKAFAEQLMSAEADALCGAGWGERSDERTNRRNGYRERTLDTRAGTIELAIPKLRSGSYFPDWLLEPRRRAERALVAVVAQCYLEASPPAESRTWPGPLASSRCRRARSATWRAPSTPWSRRSAAAPSTPAPTPTCAWTPWSSGCGRTAGCRTWPWCWPPA